MQHVILLVASILIYSISASGQSSQADSSESKFDLQYGGALRFNYNYSTWKPNQQKRGGDFGFEVFRINVDAQFDRWGLHLDQRFYSAGFGGAFLKYGWLQYDFKQNAHLKFGLIPAYFGVQQFNSHSWFFQLPFYLGFEDDHDMGISYSVKKARLELDLGFYKNAEELNFSDNNPISDARYNYDFAGRNKEVNQLNARLNFRLGKGDNHRIGTSIQYGGIWNLDTQDMGSHSALGLQYELRHKRWNIKAQALTYDNQAKNAEGESRDLIAMTAYGAPYNTAAKASIYTLGISYKVPLKHRSFNSLEFYNDYAYMDKSISVWEDTQMNVLGVLIDANPVYIYIDHAMGLHQPWLGPEWENALTTGDPDQGWESRTNVNIGYYF